MGSELVIPISRSYDGSKLIKQPLIKNIDIDKFCAFCLLESHIKGTVSKRTDKLKEVVPLIILVFFRKL